VEHTIARLAVTDPDDDLLAHDVRALLEQRWWRPIEVQSSLDTIRHQDDFVGNPVDHPALFADHGVVHVRDIAAAATILGTELNGLLLAHRPPDRQQFVTAVALVTTYLHDVGMVDMSPTGRRIHAIVAAQLPFDEAWDNTIAQLIAHRGCLVRHLEAVAAEAPFGVALELVLREVLSLNLAHSKSTVPIETLARPDHLRRLVQACVFTSLDEHRRQPRTPAVPSADDEMVFSANTDRYDDPRQSYGWMVSAEPAHRALVHDVIDGLRILRAADALRQRGTSLRTAAGYEIFIDAATGHAVYALREPQNAGVHFLRVESSIAAGEANVRSATITADGHLRVALHRGSFESAAAFERAAAGTAAVIASIALDVLPTFADPQSGDLSPPICASGAMRVLIERPSDHPAFADEVSRQVGVLRDDLIGRVDAVAGISQAEVGEQDRYLHGAPVDPTSELAARVISGAATRGTNVVSLDPGRAFTDVRVAHVDAEEELLTYGSPATFVYLPTTDGLWVYPLGGYAPEPVPAWFPLGVTGAIRRAEHNSAVFAHTDLDVIIIPTDVYLAEWFRPLAASELPDALRRTMLP
jgi:hypothetical protein